MKMMTSYDDELNFESNVGSHRYPVHDCCEFENAERLKNLLFVRDQSSDDNDDELSSDASSSDDDRSGDEVDPEHEANAAAAAAMGHSPAPIPQRLNLRSSPHNKESESEKEVDRSDVDKQQNTLSGPAEMTDNTHLTDKTEGPLIEKPNTSGAQTSAKKQSRKEKKRRRKRSFYCPYDVDERDFDENTPLHIAIHACKLDCVKLLLQASANVHKKCDGSSPVHTAISMGSIPAHSSFAAECLRELMSYGADLTSKDESLHTPLYLAATFNLPQCAALILQDPKGITTLNMRADRSGGRPLHASAKFDSKKHITKSVSGSVRPADQLAAGTFTKMLLSTPGIEVDPANSYGRTPLHIAASKGNWPVVRLLLQFGANPKTVDMRGLTPGAYAAKRGMAIPNDLVPHLGNGHDPYTGQKRDSVLDPNSNTILLCHEICSRHRSCPPINRGGVEESDPPPENIRRLHVLINEETGILHSEEFHGCTWEKGARRAAMVDVLKCHEYSYLEKISKICNSLPDHPNAIAQIDPDTAVSHWSFEAALRAAGAVCEAVDKVMAGDHRNAFCAIRPPGHHAGPRGLVTCANDPDGSHGFCLLNNVAIGAAYARSMYRNDGISRVAIIDFDVHHGNGTEEIVRQLLPGQDSAIVRTPFAHGSMQAPRYRPWLDESDVEDVFFASTHGYGPRGTDIMNPAQGGWFYPASGATQVTDAVHTPNQAETPALADFLQTQTWTRMGEDAKNNCCKIIDIGLHLPRPNDVPGMQRVDLRDSYRKTILPYLMQFNPDIIFISAGFDGHKRDTMNFGYVGMIEDDYEWVTEQLVKVANSCCNGRIVSVLEGGYKIHGGIVSPFARSVAAHVRGLVDGGISRELYNGDDLAWESSFERRMVEEKERKRQIKLERIMQADMERRKIRAANAAAAVLRQHVAATSSVSNDTARKESATTQIKEKESIQVCVPPLFSLKDGSAPDMIHEQPQADGSIVTDCHEVDALQMLNEPLHHSTPLHQGGDSASLPLNSYEVDLSEVDGEPHRKRRRPQVDYKALYDELKSEDQPV